MAQRAAPVIQYRWTDGDAEWALTDRGIYLVLRCGPFEPGVKVRLKIRGLTHRKGRVLTLIPGNGHPHRRVLVAVELEPIRGRLTGQTVGPLTRIYLPTELGVIL